MMIASISSFLHSVVDFHRGNFTPLTLVWTMMGAVGLVISVFNLRDAALDAKALVSLPSGPRKEELLLLARSSLRQERLRFVKMMAVTSVGIVAAFSTPVISDEQRKALHIPYWTPTGIAITAALLAIVGIIVLQAVLDRRLRKLFYRRHK